MNYEKIQNLSKEKLFELLKIYAKNWLAHDGCWFLAVESALGLEKAIEFDREAWRNFTVIEARRIKEFLNLPENCGLRGLQKALQFRLYSTINEQETIFENDKLFHYVKTCRVQQTRRRKGLPDFPCQSVGIIEYSYFAKEIDPRIETKSISCPPNISLPNYFCVWEFEINDDINGKD
ncbi:MAG: DUF6125 family protein [Candidatus Kapaibacteriales bacterium]